MACELIQEYLKLADIVDAHDARLLIIKGWSVTFSFATLALGFQKKNWALFAVASISAFCFWLLDGSIKGNQMRYYPRMRAIEVACKDSAGPAIDWSWQTAPDQFRDQYTYLYQSQTSNRETQPTLRGPTLYSGGARGARGYSWRYFFPDVYMPHVVPMLVGAVLAYFGRKRSRSAMRSTPIR